MLDIAVATRSGLGRRRDNEDSLAAGPVGGDWYAVVADGAGGHQRGAEASRQAVASIEAALRAAMPDGFSPERLTRAVQAAHDDLRRAQQGAREAERMYSTVVALWVHGASDRALWSHVGDSRLYRLRHCVVDAVTVDDSVVQRMLDGGLLSVEQSRNHPLKSQLLAALGIDDELQPHTLAEPVDLEDGDVFLLCSDGWWEPLGDDAIAETLAEAISAQDWLDLMQERIEGLARERQDNFSAVAVWVGDPRESTRFMAGDL